MFLDALPEFLPIIFLKRDCNDRNDRIALLWALCLRCVGYSCTVSWSGQETGEIGDLIKGCRRGTEHSVLKTLPDWLCRTASKTSPWEFRKAYIDVDVGKGTSSVTVTFTWNNAKLAHIYCKT